MGILKEQPKRIMVALLNASVFLRKLFIVPKSA